MKSDIFTTICDILLPPRCPVTGERTEAHGMISPSLWQKINFIAPPYCMKCGHPFPYEIGKNGESGDIICPSCIESPPVYDTARAAFVYNDNSKPLILSFKHGDKTLLADTLSSWMVRSIPENERSDIDCAVAVPLHRFRLLKRRYNQAGILASAIARKMNIPFYPTALLRTQNTPSMGNKSAAGRAENVRGVFTVSDENKILIQGKTVLLIDDVYTTGATVSSCAKTLLNAGAGRVKVLCCARATKENL